MPELGHHPSIPDRRLDASRDERRCPGCGLRMPAAAGVAHGGSMDCSPECWSVYAEVLEVQFGNAVVFGQVHQLTVDAYAVQHAGGRHPDKSVALHLAGLHAAFELGMPQTRIPRLLQGLAAGVRAWPHYRPPARPAPMTVFAVALAGGVREHVARARRWAGLVWSSWAAHHDEVARFVASRGFGRARGVMPVRGVTGGTGLSGSGD